MPRMSVSIDGAVINEFKLTSGRTTIGRRPYNDIVIENLAVSGEHAVLTLNGRDMTIEDLNSTNGTYVNGKAIKIQKLQHNDCVEIGRYKLQVIVEEGAAQAETAPPAAAGGNAQSSTPGLTLPAPARIQVIRGSAAGREVPLVKAVTTLGKPGVVVAAITQHSSGYTIALVDGPTPPTVNGQAVGRTPVQLHHNDQIDLAGTHMRFIQT